MSLERTEKSFDSKNDKGNSTKQLINLSAIEVVEPLFEVGKHFDPVISRRFNNSWTEKKAVRKQMLPKHFKTLWCSVVTDYCFVGDL